MDVTVIATGRRAGFVAYRSVAHVARLMWSMNRTARIGEAFILLLVVLAVFAPWIAPYDPNRMDLVSTLSGPSAAHWLGTDALGHDLLSRLIFGTRVAFLIALCSTIPATLIGVSLGLLAGMRGGLVDAAVMRITDAFMCFPALILILVASALLGAGVQNLIISFIMFGWTGFARIARAEVVVRRELPYVEAVRASGASEMRVALRHVLPNILAPIIVAFTITIGSSILIASGASFLGLGVQPPTSSWGDTLQVGFTYISSAPFISISASAVIMLTVVAFNFVGDGLRDLLDPRMKGTHPNA